MSRRGISIAQAKNNLPALIHEAERRPITIERRGEPVAVLLSIDRYKDLVRPKQSLREAIERFRREHVKDLDVDDFLDSIQRKTRGREPW